MSGREVLGHQLDIFGGETPVYAPAPKHIEEPYSPVVDKGYAPEWVDTGHPPLYHGSRRMFRRGEGVLPPTDGSHNNNLSEQFDVFASNTPGAAALYGTGQGNEAQPLEQGRLFNSVTQVAPRGPLFYAGKNNKEKVTKSDYGVVGSPYGFDAVQTVYNYHGDNAKKYREGIPVGVPRATQPPEGLTPPIGYKDAEEKYQRAYDRAYYQIGNETKPSANTRKVLRNLDELYKNRHGVDSIEQSDHDFEWKHLR